MRVAIDFALVFGTLVAVDWCWTKFMLCATQHKAVHAASWSAAITGLSAFAVTSYVADHRLMVAALLGAWVGTYYAVTHGRPK